MTAIPIFCVLSLLLILGKGVRVMFPLLQRLYLPSSVIGGMLGLAVVSCCGDLIPQEYIEGMRKVPGFLINVIFATLFMGSVTPKLSKVFRLAFPQLCMGQLLGWGQYVIGLGLTGFLLAPCFGVPPAFGNLLEIGFEGGHGTVGGMTESFLTFGWEDGIALGYTLATIGMVLGIVLGMALVNWAQGKQVIVNVRSFKTRDRLERIGVYRLRDRPHAGKQTVFCDSIDSLAWHIALVGFAVCIGFAMLKGFQAAETYFFPHAKTRIFNGFPLFPLCMIGGVLLQQTAQHFRIHPLIDKAQMQRISGAALDFLVVSAVATIQLTVVVRNGIPLLIMAVAGAAWSVLGVVFLAPRIFKEAWFERAIAEFGQSLGVTATGLLLLRTVDPEGKTPAAASFGYKQLIHEPFMGGGIWTALALTLVFNFGWFRIWCFCCAMLLVWGVLTFFMARGATPRR